MRTEAFLRGVPVLAELDEESLERLAQQVTEKHVRAGDWLLREGEEAESLFIIRGGRAEVIAEGPPETLIRLLRRGDVVGELALLRRGQRSASVRARRDLDLLELGRAEFEELIQSAPSFALGLTRAMGSQLAASRTPMASASPPRSIAVLALDDGVQAAAVAEGLAQTFAGYGQVVTLGGGELSAIDQAERDADRVVLYAEASPEDPWVDLCIREVDLVLSVTSGRPRPEWQRRAAALRGGELLVFGSRAPEDFVDRAQPRELQVVAEVARRGEAVAATARRLAGRSVGVVLSGGGARALAHVGVLEELAAAGLPIDRVAGVSLGSIIAAGVASGFDSETIYEFCDSSFVQRSPTRDFVPPAYSLIRGGRARRMMQEAFGERRIEELPKRFFCLSCDLIGREPVVHRRGPLVDAIYPSMAIPAVFPPLPTTDGRLLVDGGVLDNLPVATMARTGEGPVIAVDVTGRMGGFAKEEAVRGRLGAVLRRVLTGSEAELPRLGETIVRAVTVGSIDTVTAARLHADLVITPPVDGIGLMDWKMLPRVRELGRQAAREAIAQQPELLQQLSAVSASS